MKRPRKCFVVLVAIVVVGSTAFAAFKWLNPPRHLHCIKGVIFELASFAEENGGRYPASERGWADALLQLSEGSDPGHWIPVFTGVDDDGSIFREAIASGEDIDESQCTRVYVQGLTSESNLSIAILFDRHSVRGGDHFRSPLRKPLREVILVGGNHKMVYDDAWPEFVASQRSLLKEEGFSEELINEYYGEPR